MGVDDVDVVRKGYAAFSAGDLDSLRELFTEDATWSVPGASPYSGTKRGRDAILAYFVDVVTASEGTFQTVQVAVSGGDGYVFSLDRTSATRNGVSVDTTGVNVFQLNGGRVESVQQYFEDTGENDRFWS